MEVKQFRNSSTHAKRETNLRDWLLRSANNTEERAEHTKQGEDGNGRGTSGFGFILDSKDGVNLGQFDELEDCLADERNRGPGQGRLGTVSIHLKFFLFLGFRSLLNLELDMEGLLSEGLSVRGGVTDVDVAEENIFGHRPELDTDTPNLMKGLSGSLVLKEARVGDLARSPDTLVRRVVNERSVPFALVIGVGLGGAKFDAESANSPERAT